MKEIFLEVWPGQTRVLLVEDGVPTEYEVAFDNQKTLIGNIYKGKIKKVLLGTQSVFVDIGLPDRNAYLPIPQKTNSKGEKLSKRYRAGEDILVQVEKEPGGDKGVCLKTNIGLPGHAMVLLPFNPHINVSRKITSGQKRHALQQLGKALLPEGMGAIFRTACLDLGEEELQSDLRQLLDKWQAIVCQYQLAKAPCLLYEASPLLERFVRDKFLSGVCRMVTGDDKTYETVKQLVQTYWPHEQKKVENIGCKNVFTHCGYEDKLKKLLAPKVWLPGGGYLVIQSTEAMTVIDVNSGKFIGKQDPEQTALTVNLEAAKAIAHQLRLRDIGGSVVVDFIGMKNPEHMGLVKKTMVECLKTDKRTMVFDFTPLGLLELTRKRTRLSVLSKSMDPCHCCKGTGIEPKIQTIALHIFHQIAHAFQHTTATALCVKAHKEVIDYIRRLPVEELGKVTWQVHRRQDKTVFFVENLP